MIRSIPEIEQMVVKSIDLVSLAVLMALWLSETQKKVGSGVPPPKGDREE